MTRVCALVQSVPPVASPAGVFRGDSISSLPTNSTEILIRSPLKTPAGEAMPPVDWTSLQRSAARGNIPRRPFS